MGYREDVSQPRSLPRMKSAWTVCPKCRTDVWLVAEPTVTEVPTPTLCEDCIQKRAAASAARRDQNAPDRYRPYSRP